jgi:hypothetical protein
MEKECFLCKQTKQISEFYPHKAMADGHLNKCKDCTKEYERQRRLGDFREKILAYDRARANLPHRVKARAEYSQSAPGKEAHARAVKKWTIKHPNRKAANTILGNAIRDGKVIRQLCFVCGNKAHAHHPDYDRPLDVMWLCPKHHKETHDLAPGNV